MLTASYIRASVRLIRDIAKPVSSCAGGGRVPRRRTDRRSGCAPGRRCLASPRCEGIWKRRFLHERLLDKSTSLVHWGVPGESQIRWKGSAVRRARARAVAKLAESLHASDLTAGLDGYAV